MKDGHAIWHLRGGGGGAGEGAVAAATATAAVRLESKQFHDGGNHNGSTIRALHSSIVHTRYNMSVDNISNYCKEQWRGNAAPV